MTNCAAAHLGGCEGRIDGHHFLKAQRIRTQFPRGAYRVDGKLVPVPKVTAGDEHHRVPLQAILSDSRNLVPVCRRHHDLLHGARIYLPVPDSVRDFCAEYGLEGWLDRYTSQEAA